jgi:hypothetical protein
MEAKINRLGCKTVTVSGYPAVENKIFYLTEPPYTSA